jgi:type IV pilus modification protein PilV
MRNYNNKNGFNLIEVLIALVILSVVLLGIASFINITVNVNKNSGDKTIAGSLAQDKLEDIMSKRYTQLSVMNSTQTETYGELKHFPSFKRVTDIKVNLPDNDMKLITVTVFWKNDVRWVRLQSIKSNIDAE